MKNRVKTIEFAVDEIPVRLRSIFSSKSKNNGAKSLKFYTKYQQPFLYGLEEN